MALSVPTKSGGGTASLFAGSISAAAQNVTAGNLLVVAVSIYGTYLDSSINCIDAITDTAGNKYTLIPDSVQFPYATGDVGIAFYYCTNCLGNAANVIKAHFNHVVQYTTIYAWQIAGADTVNPFDSVGKNAAASPGSTFNTNAFSTANADTVICLMGAQVGASANGGASSGFTLDDHSITPAQTSVATHGIFSSVQSGITPGFTNASGTYAAVVAVAFKIQNPYTLSGNIGVAGATVSYSGTDSGSVISLADGSYSISVPNGSYTITPILPGYSFSTSSSFPQTVSGASITGINFTVVGVPSRDWAGAGIASDSFQRADGTLGANWTALSGIVTGQIVSHTVEPTATSTTCGQYYNAFVCPNDQTSEVILGPSFVNESGTVVTLAVRNQKTSDSGYFAVITNSTAAVYRHIAGASVQLGSTVTGLTIAAGDVWTFQIAGAVLSLCQNYGRIFYVSDIYFTSGAAGFLQSSTVAISHAQISSWKGYSAVEEDGVWRKQGIVIPGLNIDISNVGSIGPSNCSAILYEAGAQILSGTVYKTLFSSGPQTVQANIFYAESYDGITWARYATPVLAGYITPGLIKSGSTYYMYAQPGASAGSGDFALYTSSDMITWAQVSTTVLGLGSAGQWDSQDIWSFSPVDIVAGTWYALYSAGFNGSYPGYCSTGLATSSDGITWAKYGSAPVISGYYCNQATYKVGSTYYLWAETAQPGQNGGVNSLDPAQTVRFQSTDFINWTNRTQSLHTSEIYEGANSVVGQCYPNAILNIGGKAYAYCTASSSDHTPPLLYQLSLATASVPVETLVTGPEDGVVQTASDAFTSGAGPLGANWTTQTGKSAPQIIAGNLAESTATGVWCGAVYTGLSFSNDQYSEITVHALTANNFITGMVRADIASWTDYEFNLTGPINSAYTSCAIFKVLNGVRTQVGPTAQVTPQVGDVFRLQALGNVISLFQNGFQILRVQDTSIASGKPGFSCYVANDSLAGSQASLFAAGNSGAVYSISGSAGIAGATVSYSGAASGSVTADGSGNYNIPSLAAGSYTITPSKIGYSFSPVNASETISIADIAGVNFTATQLQVATPTFSPVAGTYSSAQSVTVSSTDSGLSGFAMYYTTDGSTPTTGSTLYTGAITVSASETIKVLAVATGYINSAVASGTYTIGGSGGSGFNFDFRFRF
jgi:hypothetical protein